MADGAALPALPPDQPDIAKARLPIAPSDASHALARATAPEEVVALEKQLDIAERLMRESGLFTPAEIREVNAVRMRARWKLGRLLSAVDRATGPGRGKIGIIADSFMALIRKLDIDHKTARLAQRIGTLPEAELDKALNEAASKDDGFFASFSYLLDRARPYWYAASRQRRHQIIQANAMSAVADNEIGPFALIYADPPWQFETYSEKGAERTADQHYPTLSDDEIATFCIGDRTVGELAAPDAALLLWCTSSNLHRALWIMATWGFEFRASAVWVKDKAGLGLVFRVRHEVLLYGIRGDMPGPQFQPASVFEYPRGRHSAKPPEIREIIAEKMYPDFNERSRLELFCRDPAPGWCSRGYEAHA